MKVGGTLKPYEVLEKKIECLTAEQQQSVFDYVEFLFSKRTAAQKKAHKRSPGGLTGKFSMAPDFDETPDCFKKYM